MITIIDAGISNIKSIARGFVTQGFEVRVTTDPMDVAKAASLVLPGVGAFPKAVEVLKRNGLWRAVLEHARSGKPLLGVCLGMQLLFADSDEHGLTEGLALIPGRVRRFPPDRPVPHMGWNDVTFRQNHPILEGVREGAFFYFVHSYYLRPRSEKEILMITEYGSTFVSAVASEKLTAFQFHPEKSSGDGLRLLENFAAMCKSEE